MFLVCYLKTLSVAEII